MQRVRQYVIIIAATIAGLFAGGAGIYAAQHDPNTSSAALPVGPPAAKQTAPQQHRSPKGETKKTAASLIDEMPVLPPKAIDTETLWLARCIYSETKRPEEQELVAWAVRNRVETGYRGNHSYRETVLDPYQFSAFNPGSADRRYLLNLAPHSQNMGWQRTLKIAYHVLRAEASERPFSVKTRHFFSERSMLGGMHPNWAETHKLVSVAEKYDLDLRRFRFYKDIS